MCYMTLLSTNSDVDLARLSTDDIIFSKTLPEIPEQALLKYQNKWYIGSSQGCSCSFRHLMSCNYHDLGFSDPVEWFPEEPGDIEATLKLIRIIKDIVSDGSKLECIDAWRDSEEERPDLSHFIMVNLNKISETAFRFIENSQHEFTV